MKILNCCSHLELHFGCNLPSMSAPNLVHFRLSILFMEAFYLVHRLDYIHFSLNMSNLFTCIARPGPGPTHKKFWDVELCKHILTFCGSSLNHPGNACLTVEIIKTMIHYNEPSVCFVIFFYWTMVLINYNTKSMYICIYKSSYKKPTNYIHVLSTSWQNENNFKTSFLILHLSWWT